MNKRLFSILLLVSIFALLSIGSNKPGKIRLTIINKSGMKIAVQLNGKDKEEFYYLQVPKGERGDPTSKDFTLVADTYSASIFFLETWDPVYGYQCGTNASTSLNINTSSRLVVKECEYRKLKVNEKDQPRTRIVPANPINREENGA